MLKYLKTVHQLRATADLVVIGNQSADMDSCCTAIMTAYLATTVDQRPSVPMIQIPRAEMKLRKDIQYVFRHLGIDESWLLFQDELALTDSSHLFVVDHNAPTSPGKPVAVIDHHAIEDPSLDLSHCSPLKIVKSASCMSAVINYYANTDGGKFAEAANATESGSSLNGTVARLFQADPVLAPLALAPIVQDSANMTSKVEEEDVRAVQFLNAVNPTLALFSPFAQFAAMKAEKKNLDGLTAVDLLRKDYKQWGAIGISSLPKLFSKLAKKGFDIPAALESYGQSAHLDIMIALANGTFGPQEIYVRQLAIWGPSDFDIAQRCPDLQLEPMDTRDLRADGNVVRFYNQRNTKASRKQVAPDVKRAYAQYAGAESV